MYYVINFLLLAYLFGLWVVWFRCLIFVIKDFLRGDTNENI